MSRAADARREVNQEKLNEIRGIYETILDGLQKQIDSDDLDNLELTTQAAIRDITKDTDEWRCFEHTGCKSVTLHIVTRYKTNGE